MAYDYPSTINASAGIGEILNYINDVTNSWVSRMLLLAFGVIVFVGFLKSKPDDDFKGAFAVGSYATFVIGFFLFLINFVDGVTLGITLALTIISTAILLLDKR